MKLEKGKFYKTRDGRKAEVLTTEIVDNRPAAVLINGTMWLFYGDGRFDACGEHRSDLVAEWQDPYKQEGWAIVYFDRSVVFPLESEEIAKLAASVTDTGRVAYVRIEEIPSE